MRRGAPTGMLPGMAAIIPIPDDFQSRPFRVADALDQGVSAGRLRGGDLEAPLWGVRSLQPVSTRLEFLRAAAERLSKDQAFGGSAAAAIWGLPLPTWMQGADAPIVVVAKRTGTVPKARGFVGVRLVPERLHTVEFDGFTVTDPVLTWCLLAREVGLRELVAAGDVLISPSERTDRRAPKSELVEVAAAVDSWRRAPGAVMLRKALDRMRPGVDSPMESVLRQIIVDAGFDEPEVQPGVEMLDGRVLHPDVGYRELKIGIEYEGVGHADPERMRADITRLEDFAEVGWHIIRVTVRDLFPNSDVFLRRLAAAIEGRRASA